MNRKSSYYPIATALLFGICSFIFGATEYSRVQPDLMMLYISLKVFYGLFGVGLALYWIKHEPNDFTFGLFMSVMMTYCLAFMWLAPLYELAYLECALGSGFLYIRRNWIYPTIYGLGFLGVIATYQVQDRIGWTLPPVGRSDWYWIMFVFFALSWMIQKFAIGSFRKEKEQLLRYSLLGQETTRLTHDIKGLLSSPMMIVDSLRSGGMTNKDDLERQVNYLAEDMSHVRDAIKSMNSLVKLEDTQMSVDVLVVVSGVLKVFSRRASYVRISLPSSQIVKANPDRLHSVFFNLILNSIEEFETQKTKEPFIEMAWNKKTFVMIDNTNVSLKKQNAGSGSKAHGSGIGLDLVRAELSRINAKLNIQFTEQGTRTEIQFHHFS